MSVGFNRFEGSLGGPVPNVNNLRWFGSAVLQGQVSDFRGQGADSIPVFTMAGVDAVIPDTAADGTVHQTVIPRFVASGGPCGQLRSGTNPLSPGIQRPYGSDSHGR